MDNQNLPVLKIQRFSLHDGLGIRTTVFFKGCPLNCKWCHNPESKSIKRQFFFESALCINCFKCVQVCHTGAQTIVNGKHSLNRDKCVQCFKCVSVCKTGAIEDCAKDLSIDQIITEAKKDVAFYGEYGGITLSGGEPMLHGKKVVELIKRAKEQGLNVAIQTCGYFQTDLIDQIKDSVDMVLFDVKDTDNSRHIKNTGVGNQKIIDNLFALDNAGIKTVLRMIIVQTENDNKEHYDGVISIYRKLKNCTGIEIFAHHSLGQSKYKSLGEKNLSQKEWSPDKEKLRQIKKYFNQNKVKCKII